MLTICSRRVLEFGRSPAPTSATSDVQKSISTMEVAPSPAEKTLAHVLGAGPASVRVQWDPMGPTQYPAAPRLSGAVPPSPLPASESDLGPHK